MVRIYMLQYLLCWVPLWRLPCIFAMCYAMCSVYIYILQIIFVFSFLSTIFCISGKKDSYWRGKRVLEVIIHVLNTCHSPEKDFVIFRAKSSTFWGKSVPVKVCILHMKQIQFFVTLYETWNKDCLKLTEEIFVKCVLIRSNGITRMNQIPKPCYLYTQRSQKYLSFHKKV